MIIYNKTWLANLGIHHKAEEQLATGCLSEEELRDIKKAYPVGFYMPGPIIRIGLLLFTIFIIVASHSLLNQALNNINSTYVIELPIYSGIICLLALEVLTKKRKYYRSGVNEALLWLAGLFLITSIESLLKKGDIPLYPQSHSLELSLFIFTIGTCFILRYADRLVSAVTCAAFFAVVFFAWQKTGAFGNATMPFIIIIAAALIYTLTLKLSKKLSINYYDHCITVLKIVCLLVFYAAGNYLVVDELNKDLNGAAATIAFKPFFWCWTMILPFTYVAYGVVKKNALFLRIGLLLIAGAAYTFRTYYHVISVELALITGGSILFAVAYTIINYLKTPKYGFTYADLNHTDNLDILKIESLITAGATGHNHDAPPKNPEPFGGGDFGGGGSGGKF